MQTPRKDLPTDTRLRRNPRQAIVALGRAQGFTFVALDLAGFSSGSLNQLIALRPR